MTTMAEYRDLATCAKYECRRGVVSRGLCYRHGLDDMAEQWAEQADKMVRVLCDCGATWTVGEDGEPDSWMGEVAAETHRRHGWEIVKL